VTEYAASKKEPEEEEEDKDVCPKCGKSKEECECEDEDKKDKYILEEIPEYVELAQNYAALQEKFEALEAANQTLVEEKASLEADKGNLEAQIGQLNQFKLEVEREEKKKLIQDTFYMLPDEDKEEVLTNIDSYSLDDIEAKLSIICVRNKVSFSKADENPNTDPTVYNLGGEIFNDDAIPAWVKAVLETQKTK
jgi:hypothetical protein